MLSVHNSLGSFELRLINQLNRLNKSIDRNNLRLTTGKRINSPADDPAGFVSVNRLRTELTSVQGAAANAESAKALTAAANSALSQVATHLTTIRTKAQEAASGTLSQAEIDANQVEIDAAIDAINSLSQTSYNGKRLLDGTNDVRVSGKNSAQVDTITVFERSTATASSTIDVQVTTAATKPTLSYAGTVLSRIEDNATVVLTGHLGSASITFIDNELLTVARDRINAETDVTGVTASVSGTTLTLTGGDFGSESEIGVSVTSGSFVVTGGNGNGTANGVDAVATINGQTVTAEGLKFRYRTSGLKFDLVLNSTYTTGTLDQMTAHGSGLEFQIDSNLGRAAVLNLQSVHSAQLGGSFGRLSEVASGGGKSLQDDEAGTALNIVDDAIDQIDQLQARVGSFESQTLDSITEVYTAAEVNLTESIELIENADEAAEASQLVRNQLLADNVTAALFIIANRSNSLLQLLQSIAFG
jgi:flagellin